MQHQTTLSETIVHLLLLLDQQQPLQAHLYLKAARYGDRTWQIRLEGPGSFFPAG